jgi:hypothetical protein
LGWEWDRPYLTLICRTDFEICRKPSCPEVQLSPPRSYALRATMRSTPMTPLKDIWISLKGLYFSATRIICVRLTELPLTLFHLQLGPCRPVAIQL